MDERRKDASSAFAGQVRDNLPEDMDEAARPYRPRYKGFDEEATRNAQATADRAQEGAGARGEDANREYVDKGPAEAARRRNR